MDTIIWALERDTDYDDEVVAWAAEHGTDFRDMTPAQSERRRFHTRVTKQGLDPNRIAFAVFLAKTGRTNG